MAVITVYNAEGAKTREVELDPKALDKAVRRPLLKDALIAWLASQRQGTHKTKSRGEVIGGRSKPWRQKGTGRARQGTIRAPQFVGGGHAHALRPRDYAYRLPRQQRRIALRSALRYCLEKGKLSAVEAFEGQDKPGTRAVARFLGAIGLAGKGAVLVSEGIDRNLYLSARNIPRTDVAERRNLNAGQILQRGNVILTAGALQALVEEVSA